MSNLELLLLCFLNQRLDSTEKQRLWMSEHHRG